MTRLSLRADAVAAARAVLALTLLGTFGDAQAQLRFTISADGTEVADSLTGLNWRRCSAGQTVSGGTCTGSAARYTHEQALAYARSQTGWRLPNVKELSSIVDTGRSWPSIDGLMFPDTPINHPYWTSSPWGSDRSYAWGVVFNYGAVYSYSRNFDLHVRLVR